MNKIFNFVIYGGSQDRDGSNPVAIYSIIGLVMFLAGAWLLLASFLPIFPASELSSESRQLPVVAICTMLLGLSLNRMTSRCVLPSCKTFSRVFAIVVAACSGSALLLKLIGVKSIFSSAFVLSHQVTAPTTVQFTHDTCALFFLTSVALLLVLSSRSIAIKLGQGLSVAVLFVSMFCLAGNVYAYSLDTDSHFALAIPVATAAMFTLASFGVIFSSQLPGLFPHIWMRGKAGQLVRGIASAFVLAPTLILVGQFVILQSAPDMLDQSSLAAISFTLIISTVSVVGVLGVKSLLNSEIAQRISQAQLTAVDQSSPFGIVVTDLNFNATHVNKAFTEITGLTFEEACSQGHIDVMHPDDRAELISKRKKQDPFGAPLEFEHRILAKDNETKWVRVIVSAIVSEGVPVGWISALEDISVKRANLNALAESEEKFRAANEASPYGIIVTDKESRARHINKSYSEITGLSYEEAVDMGHRSIVHEDDIKWLVEAWESHDISTENFVRKHRILLKSGITKWVSVAVAPMYHDSELTGYVATLVDITQKREAEAAIIESEERFRVMAESSPIGIVLRDESGEVYFANAAFKDITGLDVEDLQGQNWANRIHESDRDRVRDNLQGFMEKVRNGEQATFQSEQRYVHPDGRVLSLLSNVVPLMAGQRLSGFLSGLIDMTEIKKSQEALAETEYRFRTIFEKAGDGIITLSRDGLVVAVNPHASEIFGYEPQEIVGKSVAMLMPEDQANLHNKSLATYKPGQDSIIVDCTREVVGLRKNGQLFPVELSVSELEGSEGGYIGVMRDITERKDMAEQIFYSEERFRAVTDESPAGILIRDNEDRITYINDAIATIWEQDKESLIGSIYRPQIHPEDSEHILQQRDEFLEEIRNGESSILRAEYRLVVGKQTKWISITASPIHLSDGQVQRVSEVNDITDQKEFENRLKDSEERFRTMAESSPVGIALRDSSGEVYYANQSLLTMLNVDIDGMKGTGWLDRVHPDDSDKLLKEFNEFAMLARTGKDLLFRTEHRYIVNSQIQWLYATVVPLRSNGELTGFLTSISDVTQRRKAEQRIKASEERFRVMASSSPIGIFTHDADGALTYVNAAWCNIAGMTSESAMGDGWLESLPLDIRPQIQDFLQEFLNGDEKIVTTEAPGIRDGEEYWARIHLSKTFEDEALTGVIGTTEDVTDSKNAQSAILSAKEEAERANRAKNEFLSRMSHELRTPMNAILGFAQLLDLDPLDESQREGVEQIIKAGKHLLSLINEVLDITRIEDSSFGIKCVPLNLGQIVNNIARMMEPLANQQHVAIEIDPNAENMGVLADNQRLTQVLLNLASNAIKYNKRGGQVTIRAVSDGDLVNIIVTDTGNGIPSELIERLYTPFDRLGAERSKVEGTGLGLALANRLILAMNGTLNIESEVGQGTTATVTLPFADNPAARRSHKRGIAAGEAQEISICKVMLVEDDHASILLIKQFFGDSVRFELAVAETGKSALELAAAFKPHIVLLDINLPDGSDTRVIEGILALPSCKNTQVIVTSADASQSTIAEFLQAGAIQYMTKPIVLEELTHSLEEIKSSIKQPD